LNTHTHLVISLLFLYKANYFSLTLLFFEVLVFLLVFMYFLLKQDVEVGHVKGLISFFFTYKHFISHTNFCQTLLMELFLYNKLIFTTSVKLLKRYINTIKAPWPI